MVSESEFLDGEGYRTPSAAWVLGEHIGSRSLLELPPLRSSLFTKRDSISCPRFVSGQTVLHLVMLSEVETSFSSRAKRTRHAVSLRWYNSTQSIRVFRAGRPRPYGGAGKIVPLCERGTSNNVAEGVRECRAKGNSPPTAEGQRWEAQRAAEQ